MNDLVGLEILKSSLQNAVLKNACIKIADDLNSLQKLNLSKEQILNAVRLQLEHNFDDRR